MAPVTASGPRRKQAQIMIDLYDVNGKCFRYDAFQDGPLNEWLVSVAPKLGPEFQNLSRNATIRVFEEA